LTPEGPSKPLVQAPADTRERLANRVDRFAEHAGFIVNLGGAAAVELEVRILGEDLS